jgi:hypothetical protein
LAGWDWSPLIYAGIEAVGFPVPRNTLTAYLRNVLPSTHPWAAAHQHLTDDDGGDRYHATPFIIPGLIAVHLRRGDFEKHCKKLSDYQIEFGYWSAFGTYSTSKPTFPKGVAHHEIRPELCDPTYPKLNDTLYDPPYAPGSLLSSSPNLNKNADGTVDPTTLTLKQLIFSHCWLEIDAVRDRLRAVRGWQKAKNRRELRDIYLLTDASSEWVAALKKLLREDGWVGEIRSSKDVAPFLSQTAKATDQAVDMAIAHWSEVFLGNGVRCVSIVTPLRY